MSRSTLVFGALLGLGALDATGYGVMAPVVPEIAEQTGTGAGVAGALVTCFAAAQLVAYPVFGELQRRRGATVVLAVSLALIAAGDVAFLAGDSLGVYFPSRFVQGFGAGGMWIGVVFALMERFPGEEYRRLTALLGAYSVGGVGGPAIGAVGGIDGPFAVHLALVLAGLAVLALLGRQAERPRFEADRTALRAPGFALASAAISLVALSLGALEGPLPLHFGTELSQTEIAGLFVIGSIVVGTSAVVAGRFRPAPMLGVAIVTLPVAIALAGATESVWLWLLAIVVASLGMGAGESGALGALLDAVGVQRIVLAMVVWSAAWGVGYVAGPSVAGGVVELVGFDWIGLVPVAAALVTVAVWLRRPSARRSAAPG